MKELGTKDTTGILQYHVFDTDIFPKNEYGVDYDGFNARVIPLSGETVWIEGGRDGQVILYVKNDLSLNNVIEIEDFEQFQIEDNGLYAQWVALVGKYF